MPFYTANVPLASQFISITQPLINDNFQQLDAYLNVDHSPLNGPNLGKHYAIRFVQVADPATTASELSLYNKLDASTINRLWLREPSSGTIQQLTGNVSITGVIGPPPTYAGETMILGGIKVKWGNISVTASGTLLTFSAAYPGATAFPNNCFGILAMVNQTGTATDKTITASYPTASNVTLRTFGANPVNCFWIALGN